MVADWDCIVRNLLRAARVGIFGAWYRPAILPPAAFEEFLHLVEEALAFRAALRVAFGFRLELLEQLALPAREVLRRLDRHLDIHVAAHGAAQHREPLAPQPELIAGLGPGRDLDLRLGAVDRR